MIESRTFFSKLPFRLMVYDSEAGRRELLVRELTLHRFAPVSCYSYDKLQVALSKNPELPAVIIHPVSRAAELDAVRRSGNGLNILVPFEDRAPEVAQILRRLKDLKRQLGGAEESEETDPGNRAAEIVLIGSSTGGFAVVQEIIEGLRFSETAIVLCQHIISEITQNLVDSIRRKIPNPTLLVDSETELRRGHFHVLAGGRDFTLGVQDNGLRICPATAAEGPYHPSCNLLFGSMLGIPDVPVLCLVLSGMGNDGARHLPQLAAHGVKILVQDPGEASVSGMPTAAIQTGAEMQVLGTAALKKVLQGSVA